jgi:HSP20 family protein
MNKKKPTFFELLTGSFASDDKKEHLIQTKDESKEVKTRQEDETAQKPTQTQTAAPPEEEGQLTIDVYQTASEIVIKSPVAGVRPEDLDVSISNDMITIKGRRSNDEPVAQEDYYFQELYWGPFSRSIILPQEVEINKIRASLKNGILTIRLPKVKKETIKKIAIELE